MRIPLIGKKSMYQKFKSEQLPLLGNTAAVVVLLVQGWPAIKRVGGVVIGLFSGTAAAVSGGAAKFTRKAAANE